jgi:hypothetical protein
VNPFHCQAFALAASKDIPNGQAICALLDIIECTGPFSEGCNEWHKKPDAQHTVVNFDMHFKHHCNERNCELKAWTAGFHSVNAALLR